MSDFATPDPPPPPRPIEYAEADASGWWISVIGGIALMVLGLWVLTNLYDSVVVLAWLVGISLIVAGVVELLALHGTPGLGWAVWLSSGLLIAAGIAVLVWPDITLWAIAVLAGLGLLFAGTTRVLLAFADRDEPDFALQLGIGAIGIVLGVLVLGVIQTLITFDGSLNSWWTKIVIGGLLFAFILLQRLIGIRYK